MNSIDIILEKHCPVFGNLFMEKDNKPMVVMRGSILNAMTEYAEQYRQLYKETIQERDGWMSEVNELKSKVSELNRYLEDRHTRISDLDDELSLCKERNRSLINDRDSWRGSYNSIADEHVKLTHKANEWHMAFRDLSVSHATQGNEIHELKEYIEELENTLGLRNRSNPDLTIEDES